MSKECCSVPESSTGSSPQGKGVDSCCESHPPVKLGPTKCLSCETPGRPVQRLTVGALLKPEQRMQIPNGDEFHFCPKFDCDVVYFRSNEVLFRQDDLSVPVHQKEPDDPMVPVCYCFDWTPQKIQGEIKATGQSTAVDQIKAQVKAGNCYCEVTNPQGSCCLGNVAKVVN